MARRPVGAAQYDAAHCRVLVAVHDLHGPGAQLHDDARDAHGVQTAAEAGAFPTLSRALSRWFPIEERGRANGILWMGARTGGAFAPPLAVALIGWLGWRSAFGVFGVVGLAWCAVFGPWYRDDPGDHKAVNAGELAVIRVGAAAPPEATESVPWKALLLNRTMLALSFSYFASGFSFNFS